jgi:hypothetical protein
MNDTKRQKAFETYATSMGYQPGELDCNAQDDFEAGYSAGYRDAKGVANEVQLVPPTLPIATVRTTLERKLGRTLGSFEADIERRESDGELFLVYPCFLFRDWARSPVGSNSD